MSDDSNVVPFPRQFRAAPTSEPDTPVVPGPLVDHDGALYRLEDLLRGLTMDKLRYVAATPPSSAQATWDDVVRRWPELAAECVAGALRVG